MAAPSPHAQQLLRCSVKLLFAREQLPAGLQLASPSQKALQLEVLPGAEDADVTVTDGKDRAAPLPAAPPTPGFLLAGGHRLRRSGRPPHSPSARKRLALEEAGRSSLAAPEGSGPVARRAVGAEGNHGAVQGAAAAFPRRPRGQVPVAAGRRVPSRWRPLTAGVRRGRCAGGGRRGHVSAGEGRRGTRHLPRWMPGSPAAAPAPSGSVQFVEQVAVPGAFLGLGGLWGGRGNEIVINSWRGASW